MESIEMELDFSLSRTSEMDEVVYLFLVGFLWGITNPLIKKGSTDIRKVQADNVAVKFIRELKYLGTNWKYMLPFLINQSGSVLYYFTLKSASLTFAVPIANSLAFVFTAITGWFLGESSPKPKEGSGSTFFNRPLVLPLMKFLDPPLAEATLAPIYTARCGY